MSTLKEKSQAILDEKNTKILPENIKEGVQIFDVVGTLSNEDLGYIDYSSEGKDVQVNYGLAKLGWLPTNAPGYTACCLYCYEKPSGGTNMMVAVYNDGTATLTTTSGPITMIAYDADGKELVSFNGYMTYPSANGIQTGGGSVTSSFATRAKSFKVELTLDE